MKRIFYILPIAAILLAILAVSCLASGGITVECAKVSGAPGETVDVAISFSGNPGICNAGFSIEYDSTALKYVSYTAGTVFSAAEIDGQFTKNPIIVSAYNGQADKTANGVFITLHFEILSEAANGEYPITLTEGRLGGFTNIGEQMISATYKSGSVTVEKSDISFKSITGTLTITGMPSETIFAAFYKNGQLIETKKLSVNQSVEINESADLIKLFAMDSNNIPVCECKSVQIG